MLFLVAATESPGTRLPIVNLGATPLSSQPRSNRAAARRARRAERRSGSSPRGEPPARPWRSPMLLITAVVGGVGVLAVVGTHPVRRWPDQGRGHSPDHAGEPHARRARRRPHSGKGRRPGDARGVDRLPVPDLRRVRPDDRAGPREHLRDAGHAPDRPPRRRVPGREERAAYDESVEAAAGARCAADQGGYWPFQDWVFANQAGENQGAFAAPRLTAIASAAGLDITAWKACVATGQQQAAARAETSAALAAGVNATPTMSINGQIDRGPPQRRRRSAP